MGGSVDNVTVAAVERPMQPGRLRKLQALGIFCGFAAGAWLGGAEAPIKLVNPDVSPITVSLIMVFGVFLARWSVPAFVRGTAHVRSDVRQAPHLVIWAVLAGCMWAVANTLTIYAIRDVGLSIAFPLWNSNSLLGILWGFLLFNELHYAGWKRWLGMLGGFVWVLGDLFQQYATKYVGISRGIPLSNTNQLWGLLWGVLVFHELRGAGQRVYVEVIGGSIVMALGAVAIALSSATEREHSSWQDAADREGQRYGIENGYVRAGMEGREFGVEANRRTLLDWLLIGGTTAIFIGLAAIGQLPSVNIHMGWAVTITAAMLGLLGWCGIALWRTTRFR